MFSKCGLLTSSGWVNRIHLSCLQTAFQWKMLQWAVREVRVRFCRGNGQTFCPDEKVLNYTKFTRFTELFDYNTSRLIEKETLDNCTSFPFISFFSWQRRSSDDHLQLPCKNCCFKWQCVWKAIKTTMTTRSNPLQLVQCIILDP